MAATTRSPISSFLLSLQGNFSSGLYYFVTGLLLVLPALMNQSPLVYSDSGAYIGRIWSLEAMTDRPMGYPLIMRAVSWQASLWPVVFFQGMISSWLLFEVLRQLFHRAKALWRAHVVLIAILLIGSSLPWYASQLMPDALTALFGPVLFLLFFGKQLGAAKRAFLWIWLFGLAICHLSHLAILMAMPVCLLLARASRVGRSALAPRFWWNWSGVLATILGSIFFIQSYNAAYGYGRVMAPATDLFLAGKLCESGVMYEHLERCCAEHSHPLCNRMDQLNATGMFFIWNEDSPMRTEPYDQVAMSKAIAPLTREVLSDRRNWPLMAWTTFTSTIIQLTQVNIGAGLGPYRENSSPWHHYKWRLPHELPLYMESMQQGGRLRFEMVNHIAHLALLLSIVILGLNWRQSPPILRGFVLLALGVVFFNAMATGGLANVYDRLQARVTWLVVLAACLAVLDRFRHRLMLEGSASEEA